MLWNPILILSARLAFFFLEAERGIASSFVVVASPPLLTRSTRTCKTTTPSSPVALLAASSHPQEEEEAKPGILITSHDRQLGSSELSNNSSRFLWEACTFQVASRFVQSFLLQDTPQLFGKKKKEEEEETTTTTTRTETTEINNYHGNGSLLLREQILSVFPVESRVQWVAEALCRGSDDNDDETDNPRPNKLMHTNTINLQQQNINKKKKKQRKRTFRLDLAYRGDFYCGWQRQQPKNDHHSHYQRLKPSVQQVVEDALQRVLGHVVDLRVCGRTDAGVHAVGQVARFRTNNTDLTVQQIQRLLDDPCYSSGSSQHQQQQHQHHDPPRQHQQSLLRTWRCLRLQEEERNSKFHPTFRAKTRSYVYLLDITGSVPLHFPPLSSLSSETDDVDVQDHHRLGLLLVVSRLNRLLAPLVGRRLNYYGMSHGSKLHLKENLDCTITHAKASLIPQPVSLSAPSSSSSPQEQEHAPAAICVTLTADRFLRRMVRILIATALECCLSSLSSSQNNNNSSDNHHDDTAHDDDNRKTGYDDRDEEQEEEADLRLLNIVLSRDRRASAKAAPAVGLVFVGAEFDYE